MNITKTITKGIYEYVFSLSEKISENYNIPLEDILKIWCDQHDISFNSEFANMVKLSKKQKKIIPCHENNVEEKTNEDESCCDDNSTKGSPERTPKTTKNSITEICEYVFIRGPKKGQRCVTMSKNGPLCSKHKNLKN